MHDARNNVSEKAVLAMKVMFDGRISGYDVSLGNSGLIAVLEAPRVPPVIFTTKPAWLKFGVVETLEKDVTI